MLPEIQPTAEGDLAQTPISHLFVYALDHRLTGALFLTEPSGVTHTVRLARGVPVKIRPGDDHALLGRLLVDAGLLTEELLAGALAAKGLLGDVLVLAGKIEPADLERVLDRQFRLRCERLFGLSKETVYRYFDGHCELVDWGGEPASVDPLELIWAGLKRHGPASSKYADVLEKVAGVPLALHAQAVVDRFGLDETERAVADMLLERPRTMAELAEWELLVSDELATFVYALVITRQIDLGTGALPVGADLRQGVLTPSGGSALGRVRLRAAAHRLGAAAPDPPGDGVRAPVSAPSRRRRVSSGSESSGPPSDAMPRLAPGVRSSSAPPAPVSTDAADPRVPASHVSERGAAVPSTQPSPGVEPESRALPMTSPDAMLADTPAAMPPPAERVGAARTDSEALGPTWWDQHAAATPAGAAPSMPAGAAQSIASLVEAAMTDLRERDAAAALAKCSAVLAMDAAHADALVLSAQARAMLPGADVKALVLELDDVLRANDTHVHARFVRAQLRRRLSDDAGALRDLERVLELLPGHAEAARERAALMARQTRDHPGLLSRLLRR